MWCDDPCRVNRWKGYRAVYWLRSWGVSLIADGVYSGSNRGGPKRSSPLFLGLVLAIEWSPQYEVDGRSRLWSMFNFRHCPVSREGDCCPAGWFSQVPSEVAELASLSGT